MRILGYSTLKADFFVAAHGSTMTNPTRKFIPHPHVIITITKRNMTTMKTNSTKLSRPGSRGG